MAKAIIKSFKFSIKPSKAQTAKLENTLNLCRNIYNAALQERRNAWELNRINITRFDQDKQLPFIKQTNPEYKDVHSQVLQDVLKRLDKSFQGFYRRVTRKQKAGYPRFKGKNRFDSFCYAQSGFNLLGNKLALSKIGTLKIKLSRNIVGKVKTCQIKRECGKWFVIFTVETCVEEGLPKTGESVGLDMGISAFCTLSDGSAIDNFKYYESTNKKLRVAQRSVSRKKKGSGCRKKAVLKLRQIHNRIKNQRTDFQHKVSTHLVKQFDLIAIEKLVILGMSRGIFGKQILDASWASFFQMLRYKAENADKKLVEINPNYTSQDCSRCGNRVKKDLSQRVHHCLHCGLVLDRDTNAAKNILRLGQETEMFPLPKEVSRKDIKWAVAPCLSLESPPANRFGLGGDCQVIIFS
ncbi:MAG: RNA-guided endonuclease InsQ/TnpB family protein [Pyrinomonadaceae bacterium]